MYQYPTFIIIGGHKFNMANRQENNQFIISYFEKLDIKPATSYNQFWSIIEKNHGKKTRKKLEKIVNVRVEGSGNGKELYDIKNSNLELSLDFARFSADLYRKYFDWIINQQDILPKKVLDIGCDNGIVNVSMACFTQIQKS